LEEQNWMNVSFEQIWIQAFPRDGSMGMLTLALEIEETLTLFSRGKSGGQVRDEYREEYDEGRGGLGRALQAERQREDEQYGRGR
jgi:hypothetical protein